MKIELTKTKLLTLETAPVESSTPIVIGQPGEWRIIWLLAGVLAVVYFLTAQPLASPDPTSRQLFGLTAALSTEHTAAIDHFVSGPGGGLLARIDQAQDLSYFAGHYYTASAPGSAWLAIPFYTLGLLMFGPDGAAPFVQAGVALAGGAIVLLVYALTRRLGSAVLSARYGAISVGLASVLWREAGHFGPGVFSLLLITLALWLAVPPVPLLIDREGARYLRSWRLGLLGLVCGFGPVVDYSNLLWVGLIAAYLGLSRRLDWRGWLAYGLSGLAGIGPLPIYNWLNFGKPWGFSYAFLLNHPAAHSLTGQFLGGFGWANLGTTIFGVNRGLLGPFVVLFGLWGLVALAGQRGKRPEAILLASLISLVWLAGLFRTVNGNGIERVDFVVVVLPALGVGVTVWHERFMFLTRLEQAWIPSLALYGVGLYYWLAAPGYAANLGAVLYLLPVAGLMVLFWLIWRSLPLSDWPKSFALTGLVILCGLLLTGLAGPVRPAFAATATNDLLLNGKMDCQAGVITGWYLDDQYLKCPADGKPFLTNKHQLQPYLIPVQGGKVYELQLATDGGPSRVDWLWLDDGQHPVQLPGGESRSDLCSICRYHDRRAAPPGSAYLRLVFTSPSAMAVSLTDLRLLDDSVRLEPMPGYARAALSFSFDWESAMGGLIHSKGGAPGANIEEGESTLNPISDDNVQRAITAAEQRGLDMRRGADYLLKLFGQFGIHGTFYATGYNLLDGNRNHTGFVGNPTYSWASPKNRWTTYWQTHPWYANDPFGDYHTDPAWYFGDQTDRLREAGQDIESHTFGHLYVRGTTLTEFSDDMNTFLQYAEAKNLPTVRQFAFPWKSSNSVGPAWYNWLADHGFQSVSRLYDYSQGIQQDQSGHLKFDSGQLTTEKQVVYRDYAGPDNYYYYLSQPPGEPRLLTLHDYQLLSGDVSEMQAKQVMTELLQRRGYGSIWTHPESVVTASDQNNWLRVVQYAGSLRSNGLWVDSVANLVQRRLDTSRLGLSSQWSNGGHNLKISLTNPTDHRLEGITLTLPAPIKSADGVKSFKEAQLEAPLLQPGQTVNIELTF